MLARWKKYSIHVPQAGEWNNHYQNHRQCGAPYTNICRTINLIYVLGKCNNFVLFISTDCNFHPSVLSYLFFFLLWTSMFQHLTGSCLNMQKSNKKLIKSTISSKYRVWSLQRLFVIQRSHIVSFMIVVSMVLYNFSASSIYLRMNVLGKKKLLVIN